MPFMGILNGKTWLIIWRDMTRHMMRLQQKAELLLLCHNLTSVFLVCLIALKLVETSGGCVL